MSGTAKVKPPKDDAEWARNTQRRIEQVENPASTRIGAWVLSTDPESGNLIASNVNGGAVVLANQPEVEGDADTVASEGSALKVERRTTQSGSGYVRVAWDTIAFATDDWSVSEGSTEVAVPSDGLWLITYHLQGTSDSGSTHKARVNIDGTPVMATRQAPYTAIEPSLYMSETFPLSAGQAISAFSWMVGGASHSFGSSSSDPSICTALTLTRIPIG